MTSLTNGSSMHNQTGTVQDVSGDGPPVAVSHSANISAGTTSRPDLIRPRPLAVQAVELARMSRYSRTVPSSTTTDTTTYRGPLTGLLVSNSAAIGHKHPPGAGTVKREATGNEQMGSQDNVANGPVPARSSQTKDTRPSQPQQPGPVNASAPPQTPRRGRKPLAPSVASPGAPSENLPVVKRKYTKKRPADDQPGGQSPNKKRQGATDGVTNRPTAVQAEERTRWNDARFDVPRNWIEVEALQDALLPTIRSFGTISARRPPEVSVWAPYCSQYRILQRAIIKHWATDRRPNEAPILAGLCAWPGSIMTWRDAKLHTSEEDLVPFMHPSLQKPNERPGSLLRFQDDVRELFRRRQERRRHQAAGQAEFNHRYLRKG